MNTSKIGRVLRAVLMIAVPVVLFGIVELQMLALKAPVEVGSKKTGRQQVTPVSSRGGYEVSGTSLVLKSDRGTEVVVSDMRQAGVTPNDCKPEFEFGILGSPNDKIVLLVEGCGEMGGTIWSFDVSSKTFKKLEHGFRFGTTDIIDGRYQVSLSTRENQLMVTDLLEDREWTLKPLPEGFTYVSGYSEFNGAPIIHIDNRSSSYIFADVYLAGAPVNLFGDRQAVSRMYVPLTEEQSQL